MAKRELSSTLKNLQFMRRAAQKEETTKKEEKEEVFESNGNSSATKKCVVIMEGDPHPGAIKGRMSFLSFNPSVDKLNGDASNLPQPQPSATLSGRKSETIPDRANDSQPDGLENTEVDNSSHNANGDLKRKQAAEDSAGQHPNRLQKSMKGNKESSPNNNCNVQKQSKQEKLDWNVLRPPKPQSKKK